MKNATCYITDGFGFRAVTDYELFSGIDKRKDGLLVSVVALKEPNGQVMVLTSGIHASKIAAVKWAALTCQKIRKEGFRDDGTFIDVPDYYSQVMSVSPHLGAIYGWKD